MQTPTCGRIVYYFPNGNDEEAGFNGADKIPAIIVQSFTEDRVNLYLFPMNPNVNAPTLRWSTPHKSIAQKGSPYWDWPEIVTAKVVEMETTTTWKPNTDSSSGDLTYKQFSNDNRV